MKQGSSAAIIFTLKIMIMVCMMLILTGLIIHVFSFQFEYLHQSFVNPILQIAMVCLLLMPVAVLIILGYGYFKADDYKMIVWIGAILFFISFGTYILFLIKML
jgi:hypothetical protein